MVTPPILTVQRTLIDALARKLGRAGCPAQVFETHISWVLVAGCFAYKFKKAVRFDFLDFSTLEARRFYCIEELRLNRRLAPSLYLDVVAIGGTPTQPAIEAGTPIEYAVRMRAFDQSALWSYRLVHGLLDAGEIDELAGKLARFHQAAAVADAVSGWARPEAIEAIARDNFDSIGVHLEDALPGTPLLQLRQWDGAQRARLHEIFLARRAGGSVRECHGDLHTGNIVTFEGRVEAFDCIEFNPALRWGDVMNDLAFLGMDLACRGRGDLAARLVNRYLEAGGDYGGLPVLRYYQVQRALVRCKVALLRAAQADATPSEARDWHNQAHAYLAFALQCTVVRTPLLMITHGFSGSGKSTLAQQVVESFGALQLRSDVERKRMHGLDAGKRGDARLYGAEATALTYGRLLDLAEQAIRAGWPVIVDAAFLQAKQRMLFARLAARLGVPFCIFEVVASEATLRNRVAGRRRRGGDPSDADIGVLARQLAEYRPLGVEEKALAIRIDMEHGIDQEILRAACAHLPLTDTPSLVRWPPPTPSA